MLLGVTYPLTDTAVAFNHARVLVVFERFELGRNGELAAVAAARV